VCEYLWLRSQRLVRSAEGIWAEEYTERELFDMSMPSATGPSPLLWGVRLIEPGGDKRE
jgi:hypothetical protein